MILIAAALAVCFILAVFVFVLALARAAARGDELYDVADQERIERRLRALAEDDPYATPHGEV